MLVDEKECSACEANTVKGDAEYCIPCQNEINAWHDSQPGPTSEELECWADLWDDKDCENPF